jgi:predicted nucleic acid-binding protein
VPGVFVDTWGWVALLDAEDKAHGRVDAWFRESMATSLPIVTSWAVIGELFTFAASKRGRQTWGAEGGALITDRMLAWLTDAAIVKEVISPTHEQWLEALQLRRRHASIADLSLVDCSIPVLCRARQIQSVVSGDSHLRIVFPGVELLPGPD